MKFDISSLAKNWKGYLGQIAAFGNKNAPILMTGSSIAIGWYAVYLFWKQSRNADKRIAYEAHPDENTYVEVSKKRKVTIYFEYCWMSLALGLTSTGLAVAAQKLSLDRLAEMYVMTHFLTEKNEQKDKVIEKFEETVGEKKAEEVKKAVREAEYSDDEIAELYHNAPGVEGGVLIIDGVMHNGRKVEPLDFEKGLDNANDILMQRFERLRKRYIDKKLSDPYFVVDGSPYPNEKIEEDMMANDMYATMNLTEFLNLIGMVPKDSIGCRIGEFNEFRFYGGKPVFTKKNLLNFVTKALPDGTKFTYWVLDYGDLIEPTAEMIERNPL